MTQQKLNKINCKWASLRCSDWYVYSVLVIIIIIINVQPQKLTKHAKVRHSGTIHLQIIQVYGMLINALIGNKSVLEAGGLHCSSARKCICYLVNYSNVLRCNL